MTYPISDVTRRVVYSGSLGTGPYPFTFEILTTGDIGVYKNTTLLTLSADYTVTINADGTGSVTLTSAATSTDTISIFGNKGIQRQTDFTTGGDLFANSLNDELDAQTIFAQQNAEAIVRAIRAPQFDPTNVDMVLPSASDRADAVLTFDTNGDVQATSQTAFVAGLAGSILGANYVTNTATGDGSTVNFTVSVAPGAKGNIQIYIDGVYQNKSSFSISGTTVTFTEAPPLNASVEFIIGYSIGSTTGDASGVDFTQQGTGAVQTTVAQKLWETVSVKDFGAVGDGVTDDTAAIQAAIDSGSGKVIFPNGTYKVTDTLTVGGNVHLIGQSYNLIKAQIVYTSASSSNYVFSITGPYNGIQGLYITTTNANIGAIYRQDCSHSRDQDLVIEGDFRYGWRHKHTGTGGYYNSHEKIFVSLASSTYVDNVGIWCEGYYSASEFSSCATVNCVTGMKFDYGNAVTILNAAVENTTSYGIYIGGQTIGMSIIAPYFENNVEENAIHCEIGAQTINVDWARGSRTPVNSITSRNQLNINGGLTASFQKYGFKNLLKNPQGYLQATTGVPYWTTNQATVSRETVNTNDSPSAIKVTAAAGANSARISQAITGRITTNLYKTFTISGRYYVPSGQTTDCRYRIIDTATSTEIQAGQFTRQGAWATFNNVIAASTTTQEFTLEIYAAWNAGGTTTGSEYVIVTDLCFIHGEYFAPNQETPTYTTYQETALVTTNEVDYQEPIEFCGYTAISSGATTVTVTYPTWFTPSKILTCVATCGSNTPQAIKAEPTTSNVVFTIPSAPTGSMKIWYSIKAI